MKRFWKYLQGDLHIAFSLGRGSRRDTGQIPCHIHKADGNKTQALMLLCCQPCSMEIPHCIATCKGQSRGGCTGGTCRRWWCSTSRASCSTGQFRPLLLQTQGSHSSIRNP